MNRRRFLELLGLATAGATVAYSFPDIIVPKNIIPVETGSVGSMWAIPQMYAIPLNLGGNWANFYALQLKHAQDWFQKNQPNWEPLDPKYQPQRGVRFYFK